MDTESLRLFVLAADTLNISAAGRQLGLAPSVASARLAKLEIEVGADLLHRSTRKVALSLEGAEFLPYAKEILAQENAAMAAMGKRSPEIKGTLRFAASSSFAQLYVIPILAEFLERYPSINVELKLSDTPTNLIEGAFDLALRNSAMTDSSFHGRKLAEDTRILCASPSYLAAHGTPISPEDLNEHHLLVFMNSKPRSLKSKEEERECSFPPPNAKWRVSCDDGTSMRLAAQNGIGICMCSTWSIRSELDNGSLVRVLPSYQVDDQSAIWLVYPKTNALTSKVRAFIDFLLEKMTDDLSWQQ